MPLKKRTNKIFQRRLYDFLSSKYFFCILLIVIGLAVALINFFEIFIYLAFKPVNKAFWCPESLPNDTCPVYLCDPIDAVYTWVNGSDPDFVESLNHFSTNSIHDKDMSRYDDKYELKFSLRSLELYMPWIRKVYIVTNGQIPHWLDLDYDRVAIVTHDELIREDTDGPVENILPTFSSPAIETFIHRIPNLSERFIYLNDDVMIGSPALVTDWCWGDKRRVPTAWPVPDCTPQCAWAYVGDGSCDSQCNTEDCQYDGGDCQTKKTEIDKKRGKAAIVQNAEIDEYTNDEVLDTDKDLVDYKNVNFKKLYQKQYEDFAVLQEFIKNEANLDKINNTHSIMNTYRKGTRSLLWNESNSQNSSLMLVLKSNQNISNTVEQHNTRTMQRYKSMKRRSKKRKSHTDAPSVRTLDMYARSLIHTNKILNERYGFEVRRVPAHIPFMLEKSIVEDMQLKFPVEIAATRRNRFRRANDFQFSFAYYHFMVNEKRNVDIDEIFNMFDTDKSGTWSDREIRTLLVRMFDEPLQWEFIKYLEDLANNCTLAHGHMPEQLPVVENERYADSKMPTVTKALIERCLPIRNLLNVSFGQRSMYGAKVVAAHRDNLASFVQLTSNISNVITALDSLRKPRKFICINDNLSSDKPEHNEMVRAHLYDFYESLFPLASRFELPVRYRNRFARMHQVRKYRQDHIKLLLYMLIMAVAVLTMYYYKFLRKIKKKIVL